MQTYVRNLIGVSLCLAVGLAAVKALPLVGFSKKQVGTGGGSAGNGVGGQNRPPASGTWALISNSPPFSNAFAGWQMTDGTILVATLSPAGGCYKFTPDITGNYANGTWSTLASMHTPRLYFGSGILDDGRLIVCGGEYSGSSYNSTWTNACEYYTPSTNTWTTFSPPSGWGTSNGIGDAPSMVLPNGEFLLGHDFDSEAALFNPATNTWSSTFADGLGGSFDEDSWTLLPNNRVLDIECSNTPNTEYYNIATNAWVNVGTVPGGLVDSAEETGANVLLPNGTVFAIGATANTDIYNIANNSWSAGPSNPVLNGTQLCQSDAPAAVLPDGNVLMALSPYSPGNYPSPTYMYEYNYTSNSITAVNNPSIASSIPSYAATFLLLPTGQVMMFSQSNQIYIYTPAGTYQSAWQPTITTAPVAVNEGSTNNSLSGTQFTGVSQGAAYGDDNSNYTNYPIVRVVNNATGHVYYCVSHTFSTRETQTGSATVSTEFDVPSGVPTGPSNIYVVANGIPSAGQAINVVAPHVVLPYTYSLVVGSQTGGGLSNLFYEDSSNLSVQPGATTQLTEAPVQVQFSGTSPTLSPASFQFTFAGEVNSINLSQIIELYNFTSGTYQTLSTTAGSTGSDSTVTVTATGTLSQFVNQSTGEVRARVNFNRTGATSTIKWTANYDLVNWIIQ